MLAHLKKTWWLLALAFAGMMAIGVQVVVEDYGWSAKGALVLIAGAGVVLCGCVLGFFLTLVMARLGMRMPD
jgi:hypothetical protein